jgi:hypothetical protein
MYWKLKNSKNASDVEKAELISRNTKYYSYILVIEDEQNRDLEGKVMIYPYGYKIKEKIKDQKEGTAGEPCNVFDLANGKDFRLVIKQLGEFPNYDSSTFLPVSPISIQGHKVPVTLDEKGKNKITNPKVQEKVRQFLLDRTVDLEDHQAKQWTPEEAYKVSQILEILSGNEINLTEKQALGSSFDNVSTNDDNNAVFGDDEDASNFFEIEGN